MDAMEEGNVSPHDDKVDVADAEETLEITKVIGKEQCAEVYKACLKVKLQNEMYAEKLRLYKKVTKRLQKERSFLMKKLNDFGDNYKDVKLTIEEEEPRGQHCDSDTIHKHAKKIKKKLKAKRLQNAPKKPSNAFLMFCQKNRALVQKEHQRIHKTEIGRQEMTRRLAEIWKETPVENKKAYYEMYEKDKARYALEMKKFEGNKPSTSHIGKEDDSKSNSDLTMPEKI